MVGVPAFEKWLWGPSMRISSPIWRFWSMRISTGPRARHSPIPNTTATAVRNVTNRNTLRAENHSLKDTISA